MVESSVLYGFVAVGVDAGNARVCCAGLSLVGKKDNASDGDIVLCDR